MIILFTPKQISSQCPHFFCEAIIIGNIKTKYFSVKLLTFLYDAIIIILDCDIEIGGFIMEKKLVLTGKDFSGMYIDEKNVKAFAVQECNCCQTCKA